MFDASAIPVLLTVPQVAEVVGEVMCTEALAAGARSKPLPPHVRTPVAIAQDHPPVVVPTLQFRPGLVGSVSFITTSKALPSPLLVTVIVYPICSPALTLALSAVF